MHLKANLYLLARLDGTGGKRIRARYGPGAQGTKGLGSPRQPMTFSGRRGVGGSRQGRFNFVPRLARHAIG